MKPSASPEPAVELKGDTEQQLTTVLSAGDQVAELTGWRKIYYGGTFQILLVSLTCFCCPGMFNALSGLGGGGKTDSRTADLGNVALYSTFSVFGFMGGSICNRLGARPTLTIGALGYSLYIGALLSTVVSETQSRENFVIAAGAILGVCAGMLWTAQGALMMAYASEKTKGRYIALFWAVFNLGAVVGAAIPLGQNFHKGIGGDTPVSTYTAFLVITLVGACIPFALANPQDVRRSDGSRIAVPAQPTFKSELTGLWFALRRDPFVVLLFPFFLASNFFYTFSFNGQNGSGLFTYRAKTLNNLGFWCAQILGSGLIGIFLDCNMPRRLRAWGGWLAVLALLFAAYGGNYAVQKTYTRASVVAEGFEAVDVYNSRYAGLIILYICNGVMDACWQSFAYWTIGALSNDVRKLAYYAGFYKGLQSAGAAIAFRIDSQKIPFMTLLAVTWALCAAGLLIMSPVLLLRVKNTTKETVVDAHGDVVPEKA